VAFPLHPEYRTLPMVWYIPPLSPVQNAAQAGKVGMAEDGIMPDIESLRIPVKYLANLLTAGKEEPVVLGLKRMIAMRHYMRSKHIKGEPDTTALDMVDLTVDLVEDMYKIMAIANYEDRFVIPTGHKEETLDAFGEAGGCGFTFGSGCSSHSDSGDMFDGGKKPARGQSGSTKDNRVNTLFNEKDYIQEYRSGGGCSSGGCGSGGCG